ncbi:MAG TPA: YifB family Mg chelatase-like AAA ATPase [Gammaproteobacteria bacterium]|nr:YifB family Mg chelatase-like AAA ATPase [Gammaproteobacteria bacterium]
MTLAIVHSRAQVGVQAPPVAVEVHLSNGLPSLSIVGLPEAAVKESKERVRGALLTGRFEFPARRITINLAPADLPKDGGRFDLPIALGILAASGQIPADGLVHHEFLGELALSGELRPVRGALPAAVQAHGSGRRLVVPAENACEAALVSDATVYGAGHLLQVSAHLCGRQALAPAAEPDWTAAASPLPDLADVRGQQRARRALEVAASGSHSLLMVGPPGTGKTLLASRLPGILPALEQEQALEAAAVRSVSGQGLTAADWRRRPFRTPHHTASAVALVGGGSHPRPGEISLAHHGVLFLDELPEFDRRVLEVLREPLESGRIVISRAARQAEFPARFQLVAAMNPCPCGYHGDADGRCRCTPDQIRRYRSRISGPLLDRIDMQIEVPRPSWDQLQGPPGESSAAVRGRVEAARHRQRPRGTVNAELQGEALTAHCGLSPSDRHLLQRALERLGLSARAYHRILRVARTIADLDRAEHIATAHLTEAIQYRCLDRGPA